MILRTVICLAVVFLLSGTMEVFAGETLSLARCLGIALEKNPRFEASRLRVEQSDREVKMARADFLPGVTSSLSVNRLGSISSHGVTDADYLDQDVHSANVKLTQILYAGSRLVNSYDRAEYLRQATQADYELARLELIYNIEVNFFKMLKTQQDLLTAQEAVTRLESGVKVAEAFFGKELVPQVDVLKAQVDLDDAYNQLSIARNNEKRQRTIMYALMNLPVDMEAEFVDERALQIGAKPSYTDCYQFAMEHRPDIKSLNLQKDAAEKQSSVALGKYLPMVRLEAGYYDYDKDYEEPSTTIFGSSDRDQRNRYWMAGLFLSWDLFDGGKAWYENEKYELEAQRFRTLVVDALNTISTGIRRALYSLAEAEQRIAASTSALDAAEKNYQAEDNRLKAGVSTITALLDAQSRLVRAQVNAANAAFDYRLAQSELKLMTARPENW
jgi:outer membrane protein TolC